MGKVVDQEHPLSTATRLVEAVQHRDELPLRPRVVATFAAVGALHLAALGLLLLARGQHTAIGLGVVLAAYGAGLKHSYDWDHIAAIDNSTRKLVGDGMNPASVGFAFSLGHSSVVTLATALVVMGVRQVHGAFADGGAANRVLGTIGAAASGGYLLVLGLYNALATRRIARALAAGGTGTSPGHQHDLEASGGLVARLVARPLRRVRRPRDIFVVGFLFGLGFDTATTIGLMALTVGASLAGVSAWALLGLPFAFASAMTLCDSLNGLAMMHLYRSALATRERRMRLNLAVTAASSASALGISVLTLGALAHDVFGLDDPVTTRMAGLDLGSAGLLLVALMATIWLVGRLRSRRH